MRSLARAFALASSVALSATVLPAQQVLGRNEETFTWSERVARGDWFRFISPTGDVEVTEGSGDKVEVRAEKILRRGRVDDIGFVVERGREGIVLCAVIEDDDECNSDGYRNNSRSNDGRRWRNLASLKVTIRLPAGVKVHAQSGNGDVSVSGAGDEVLARSGNGRVNVRGGTEVSASSGNGEVTVDGAKNAVSASSGNGDVTVTTSRGPVSARSGNGDLNIRMDTLREAEDMEFSTGNGRIVLSVPSSFAGEIDATSGNGDVVSDFPIKLTGRITKSRLRGTIGDGGRKVRLSSGNGRIELREVK